MQANLPVPVHARRIAMATLMCATVLAALDTTMANAALPQIAANFRASEAAIVWLANAYQIAMIATLLPFAAFGENFGFKWIYRATRLALCQSVDQEAKGATMT